ncbi:hypothetical protein ACIGWV_41730, partial [Streptomyces sp. NPDC055082]
MDWLKVRRDAFTRAESARTTAETYASIRRAQGTCGWVVDLRHNSGGDMWGPLASVGPILGNG